MRRATPVYITEATAHASLRDDGPFQENRMNIKKTVLVALSMAMFGASPSSARADEWNTLTFLNGQEFIYPNSSPAAP
jgi:hypothetical protein